MKKKQLLTWAHAVPEIADRSPFANRNAHISSSIAICGARLGVCLAMTFMTCQIGAAAMILVNPDADAVIQATNTAAENSNFGNSTSLLVDSTTSIPGNSRKSYLRFDLSGTAADGMIDSADLKLTLTLNQATSVTPLTIAVYGLNSSAAGQDWVEGAGQTGVSGATPPNPITWNNAPQNNTASGSGLLSQTTLLGTFTVTFGTPLGTTLDFSSTSLATFLDGAGQEATLILVEQNTANLAAGFASKEDTVHAAPLLTLDVVPEPSTVAMLFCGILITGSLGWRAIKQERSCAD